MKLLSRFAPLLALTVLLCPNDSGFAMGTTEETIIQNCDPFIKAEMDKSVRLIKKQTSAILQQLLCSTYSEELQEEIIATWDELNQEVGVLHSILESDPTLKDTIHETLNHLLAFERSIFKDLYPYKTYTNETGELLTQSDKEELQSYFEELFALPMIDQTQSMLAQATIQKADNSFTHVELTRVTAQSHFTHRASTQKKSAKTPAHKPTPILSRATRSEPTQTMINPVIPKESDLTETTAVTPPQKPSLAKEKTQSNPELTGSVAPPPIILSKKTSPAKEKAPAQAHANPEVIDSKPPTFVIPQTETTPTTSTEIQKSTEVHSVPDQTQSVSVTPIITEAPVELLQTSVEPAQTATPVENQIDHPISIPVTPIMIEAPVELLQTAVEPAQTATPVENQTTNSVTADEDPQPKTTASILYEKLEDIYNYFMGLR